MTKNLGDLPLELHLLAFGREDEPIKLWFLRFDRLGLAYNISPSGELRGIKFVFRSLYEP